MRSKPFCQAFRKTAGIITSAPAPRSTGLLKTVGKKLIGMQGGVLGAAGNALSFGMDASTQMNKLKNAY